MMKMKKIIALAAAVVVLLSLASCKITFTNKKTCTGDENIHATVNGNVEITTQEIKYFKNRLRADIINEYARDYGVTDFSDFWDKEFDVRTPTEALNDRAVEEAADAKLKLLLMQENGVYDDISFDGLKKRAEAYNAEHENAVGTVGIKTIDMESFYTYYISTGEMELKNILAEGELKPTEEEIAEAAKQQPDLTENEIVSRLVDDKYNAYIVENVDNRTVHIEY